MPIPAFRPWTPRGVRRAALLAASAAISCLPLVTGCGATTNSAATDDGRAARAAGARQSQDIARKLLGSDARVAISGDLAHNGRQEIVVMNPLSSSAGDAASGLAVRRAAVVEHQGDKWVELLRCDEYLKNSSGFLRGTPTQAVAGWRLRWNSAGAGYAFYFTPLAQNGSTAQPVEVRWNPAAGRYQSLAAGSRQFLDEMATLEIPRSVLIK